MLFEVFKYLAGYVTMFKPRGEVQPRDLYPRLFILTCTLGQDAVSQPSPALVCASMVGGCDELTGHLLSHQSPKHTDQVRHCKLSVVNKYQTYSIDRDVRCITAPIVIVCH